VALVSAKGGPGGPGGPGGFGGPGFGGPGFGGPGRRPSGNWETRLCANGTNNTYPQSYLSQTQQAITNLQANGSFTRFLADHTNEFAYLQASGASASLTANCTGFFSGLNAAKALDKQAQDQLQQYQSIASRLLSQIVQSLVGRILGTFPKKPNTFFL
jgi:hypothetical protein